MGRSTTFKEAFLGVCLIFFIVAGIPTLTVFAIGFTWMAEGRFYKQYIMMAYLSWAALFIVFFWFTVRYMNKRRRLAKILSVIKSDESYYPAPDNEIREMHSSAYFGIDTKRGTMLYIRLLNKKEIDIFGFNINNWRHCELTGTNKLRFYINSTEVPFIDIQHRRAWLLYEKICVMRNQQYNYPYNFPGYVKHNTERLSERMGFKMLPC